MTTKLEGRVDEISKRSPAAGASRRVLWSFLSSPRRPTAGDAAANGFQRRSC
jgi:hypothetical protein